MEGHGSGNLLCDFIRRLVLPESLNCPTCFLEQRCIPAIALSIARYFLRPVSCIGSWSSEMRVATVPEAPVQENSNSDAPKHDVCFAAKRWQRSDINTISEAKRVKFTAYR